MKLQGITGSGSGKLGNAVFSSVRGETIVRQYNPNVANPSTDAQVAQRAKLKLMSQLAASLQPAIAIKRQGLSSGRNQFVSLNFDQASFSVDSAQVVYENLQLTKSSIGLPALTATRGAEAIEVKLAEDAAGDIARVAYFQFTKNGEGKLTYINSVVAERGNDPKFTASLAAAQGDVVVYGYGMRQSSEQAMARYAQYNVQDGSDLATLYVRSLSSFSDVALTQTRAITLNAGQEYAGGAALNRNVFATINPRQGTVSIGDGTPGYSVSANVTTFPTMLNVQPAPGYRVNAYVDTDGNQFSPIQPLQITSPADIQVLMATGSLDTSRVNRIPIKYDPAKVVSAKVEINGVSSSLTTEYQNFNANIGDTIRIYDIVLADGATTAYVTGSIENDPDAFNFLYQGLLDVSFKVTWYGNNLQIAVLAS